MLKALSRMWLRGVKRAGAAQQRKNVKLLKSLLTPAKPVARLHGKSPAPRPDVIKAPTARRAVAAKPAAKPLAPRQTPAGDWLAFYHSSFIDDGRLPARRMNYWLYLPRPRSALATLPLVVMLHGCDQSASDFARGTRMNLLADQEGFAVVYPQQSIGSQAHRCWEWYDIATQRGGGDVGMIAGITRAVIERYPIDPTRVYIAGLSAGAAMANIVALNYPHLIAAVGLHSGPVFGAGHSRVGAYGVMQFGGGHDLHGGIRALIQKAAGFSTLPAILIHGEGDKVVRPINLAQLMEQYKIVNALSAEHERPAVHKPAVAGTRAPRNAYTVLDYISKRKLLLRVCEIHQLEHAWSGGDCSLPFNACAGPDSSRLMWDFFARHKRISRKVAPSVQRSVMG